MIAYSIFGTAPLYLQSLGAIIGSRVLVGICEAAIMTCCTTLIADYWSGARPQLGTWVYAGARRGTVEATVFLGVGGALGSAGWRTPFWLSPAPRSSAVPMLRCSGSRGPVVRGHGGCHPYRGGSSATPCLRHDRRWGRSSTR